MKRSNPDESDIPAVDEAMRAVPRINNVTGGSHEIAFEGSVAAVRGSLGRIPSKPPGRGRQRRSPGELVSLAKRHESPSWWESRDVFVRWTAERYYGTPVLIADGQIMSLRAEDIGDEGDEDGVEIGTIRVAKPYFYAGYDVCEALDDISSDLIELGSAVLEDGHYSDDFVEWLEQEFGVMPMAEPILVDDIKIKPGLRNPRDPVAAIAVLEAVAAFGSADSPIVGHSLSAVQPRLRDELRDHGLWDWADALGAKEWNGYLVAVRPQR